ncbi:MAG: hypothetical protein HYU97_00045 [Deltaproteobacteria bacterium]|nr:hypothetical protein [Deltaproteobacteria bacterium]
MPGRPARVGRRPIRDVDPNIGEGAGLDGKGGREARGVPEGGIVGSGARGATGDAKAVERGRNAWHALREVLGSFVEGTLCPQGALRLLESRFGSGEPVAEAAKAVDVGHTNPATFFRNLPPEISGMPGDVFRLINRTQGGEAAYLGDREPLPEGQVITYLNAAAAYDSGISGRDAIQAKHLVAGMVAPEVGFIIDVKTGEGIFVIHRAKAGVTRFEEIKPGANFFDKGSIPLRVSLREGGGIVLLLGKLVGGELEPSSPVVLPDISGVYKIPYGEKTQVAGGDRRVYDFHDDGNVFLDVQYARTGENRLQATLYAGVGHSVVAPLSGVAMSGVVAGKWDLPITGGTSTFFVEVDGAPYLVTLVEEGSHGYVRVTFTH